MKNALLIFCIFLLTGCASRTYVVDLHHNSFLRRMPQINRIETGRPLPAGSFFASGNISYAIVKPDIMNITDTSIQTRSNLFGSQFTLLTASNTYSYESRIMASAEAQYGFTDFLSGGVGIDASVGTIEDLPADMGKSVMDDNVECAAFVKLAKQFGRIGVCIRPEVLLTRLYGDRYWIETTGSGQNTATERLSYYSVALRSSTIARFDITPTLTPFLGFQIKSQQFPKANDELDYEAAYGFFGGVDMQLGVFGVAPYFTLPIGSVTTHFRSPVAAGVQVSIHLKPVN